MRSAECGIEEERQPGGVWTMCALPAPVATVRVHSPFIIRQSPFRIAHSLLRIPYSRPQPEVTTGDAHRDHGDRG